MTVRVYTRIMEGHSVLVYSYWCNPDMGFRFHMLCEVGQPWYAEAERKARDLAEQRGCVIKQIELSDRPWFVDALVKEKEHARAHME